MTIRTGAAVPQSVTDLLNNVLVKGGEARERKKQKGNATAYATIWADAFKEAYPEETFFAWRVKELASFKRALQRGKLPGPVIRPFIDFVVSEFPSVVSDRFGWMQKPPVVPHVAFVVKNIEVFYQAYLDKDDPNRKVRGRIARTSAPAPVAGQADTKKLEQQLAAARAKAERAERELAEIKTEKAVVARKETRKLVLKRRTASDEFGSWDG